MRDISNFGNNLRDEIIEYRLEHETGHTLKIKFVDHGDKTNAQIYLYSKTGEFLSKTEEFPFDQTGQRAVDRVELIRGSSEGHEAEYEIKVLFRGGKGPVYCPVDDILATLRKELSNKITIDLDNSGEDESSVITSKIYNTSGEELSEDHISLDGVKMTAQSISMIADAESEEAEPTIVFESDVNDKKVTVYDLDVDNSININKAKIDALEVTGDVKLGTHENSAAQPELAINTTAEFPGVAIEHTLAVKSTASFGNDVNVSGNINVESGTVSSPTIKAANAFSVGKNNEEFLKVDATGIIASGNINASGNMNLIAGNKEVSLTENDFTINSMGESDASVTNKKYVNDLVKTERERATNAENDISSSLDAKTAELRSAIEQEISDREEAVTAEVTRAKEEEKKISDNLTTETTRAGGAESALDKKITDSVTSLTSTIDEFKTKEQTDVDNLKSKLDAEVDRASGVESTLTTNLANEVTRATAKETELASAIEAEHDRADIAEKANATAIDAEKSRAKAAETELSGRLDVIEGEGEGSIKSAVKAEADRATAAESTLTASLDAEAKRATEKENELSAAISAEITRAKAEESTIASNLATEVSRATGVEAGLESSIGTANSNLNKAKEDLNKLITDETTRATEKENELSTSISNLSNSISNEIENRKSAITKEINDRTAAINTVSESLGQEVTDREEAITQEYDRATEAEGQLQKGIEAETTRATGVEEAIKADLANYAKSLELAGGKDTNYKYTFKLKDSKGTTLNEYLIDLPIESVVVSGKYDAVNKNVILTLDNGKEISFSVADLIKGLVSDATFNEHVNNTDNPHGVTKAQVGLGNVNNTSDANKPISKATQAALDKKVDKVEGKSLILDTEITRLAGMSDGANKVEASTNGKIKIDGSEVIVYNDTALSERISTIENNVHSIHSHANKDILDAISQDNINSWNSIESAKADISELQTRLSDLEVITNKLDADTVEKVKRVSTLGSIRYNDIY